MSQDGNLHVVFGTGAVGTTPIEEFVRRGRRVRAVNRSGKAELSPVVEVWRADASDPQSAREAVRGAAVVYHTAQPPYTRWPGLFPRLTRSILGAAATQGAKLVMADNLYAYGLGLPCRNKMGLPAPASR